VTSATPPDGCGEECQEALARLEAFLDGELPGAELEDVRRHLTACYPCTDRVSFEEQLRAIVRRECVELPPPSLVARIREHLQRSPSS
jgi:mycothiol system anti-sigma-R factor